MKHQHKLALSIIGIAMVIVGLTLFTPAIRQACAGGEGDEEPAPYCGDTICNNGETTSTCPADCQTSSPPQPPSPQRCPGFEGTPPPTGLKCGPNQCVAKNDCCDVDSSGNPTNTFPNRCVGKQDCGFSGGMGGEGNPTCYNDGTDDCSKTNDPAARARCNSCNTYPNSNLPHCVVTPADNCTNGLGQPCTVGGVTCCVVGTHPTKPANQTGPDMIPGDVVKWCQQNPDSASCKALCPAGSTDNECTCIKNPGSAACQAVCQKYPNSSICNNPPPPPPPPPSQPEPKQKGDIAAQIILSWINFFKFFGH